MLSLAPGFARLGFRHGKTTAITRVMFSLLTVVIATLFLTWLCRIILQSGFSLSLNTSYWYRDFLGNLAVGVTAYLLTQHTRRSLLLSGVVIVGFQLVNGAKLVVLGTPISPDDFINVHNLFYLTEGWKRIALTSIIVVPVGLALAFIRWRKPFTLGLLLCFSILGIAVQYNSETIRNTLDTRFGNSVWNQPANFAQRGLALHIVQESVRTIAKIGRHPDQTTVNQAMLTFSEVSENQRTEGEVNSGGSSMTRPDTMTAAPHQSNNGLQQRNVHIIVLESFFDPVTLGPDWVPEDPLPESFRGLWRETGYSKALSPVFGGYTANAEFEILCGFPVTENAVFFEGWLRRSVPCLPRVLSEHGYKTVASHPNVAGFWNRTLAYRLVGFNDYLSKADFDLSDSVGGLLLDHSYYDQVFEHLNDNKQAPVFNYMLTYHGHLPYPSNEQYPDQIKAGKDSTLLHGYLNQLWYKSRDLMARITQLREDDPTALIVAFGDHLPFLGSNYGVYDDVLNLPKDRADFTGDMLEYLVSTPLFIIDGERGPLELGAIPIYQLPTLILKLLNIESKNTIFELSKNPESSTVRPLYGMHIDVFGKQAISCPDDDTAPDSCHESASWLSRTRTLISDIFTGNQFSLDSQNL
ncbi:MAG: LTA synthase family protein [Granulosicoccus sp.]